MLLALLEELVLLAGGIPTFAAGRLADDVRFAAAKAASILASRLSRPLIL